MNALFYAHSGLRYLVLLAAVVAISYYVYALVDRRPVDRGARVLGAVFVGVLDLQILLGLVLMATGIYYGALIGHLVLMLVAAAVAHGSGVAARRAEGPRRYHAIRLVGVATATVLVILGIMAIGRDVFGTGLPT